MTKNYTYIINRLNFKTALFCAVLLISLFSTKTNAQCAVPTIGCSNTDLSNYGANSNTNAATIEYDNFGSSFHSTVARTGDGTLQLWGEDMANDGTSDVLSPRQMNAANYPALGTATPLKMAVASRSVNTAQGVLLATNGLYAWGNEGTVLDNAITTSTVFQKLIINTKADGLPTGVSPADVKMMFVTNETIALTTCSGDVWVISLNLNVRGNGAGGSSTQWSQVTTDAPGNPVLTNVVATRGSAGALMALRADGSVFVWGNNVYLGNNTAIIATQTRATQMTLPAGITPKMIGSGNNNTNNRSFYVLATDGNLYALGRNNVRQLGDWTTTERLSWVQPRYTSAAGPFMNNVVWISPQEHDASFNGFNLINSNKTLFAFGENNNSMLSTAVDPLNPFIPSGVTVADAILAVETGGHTTMIIKQCETNFGYVGHRIRGSMGDGTATTSTVSTFTFATAPITICGAGNPQITVSITPTSGSDYCVGLTASLLVSPPGGTISLVSGPATLSGNILTITGVGTIVVGYAVPNPCGGPAVTAQTTLTSVLCATDLSITKTVNNAAPIVGDNVTFTITATNNGPQEGYGVVVTDALPTGYTIVGSPTLSTGSWSAPNWSIGTLAVGVPQTMTITATVLATGNYVNTATISGTATDPTSANNTSTSTPTPLPSCSGSSGNILINPDFENPTFPVGNNIQPWPISGWTGLGTLANVVRTDGIFSGGGPLTSQNGSQYLDIANGSADFWQNFTFACNTRAYFSGHFSVRNGTASTGRIDIYSVDALNNLTLVASSNQLNMPSTMNVWYYAAGTAILAPGNYRFQVSMGDFSNFDNACFSFDDFCISANDDNYSATPFIPQPSIVTVGNVTTNDILSGNPVTASNTDVTPVTNGPLSIDDNGVLTLAANTPSGTYTITYNLCEVGAIPTNCDTAIATVVVDSLPIASPDAGTYILNTPVTIAVVANDTTGDTVVPTTVSLVVPTGATGVVTDVNGDVTNITITGQGTWSVNPTTGAITFTPVTGYTGNPTAIQYNIEDAQGNQSNNATVTLTNNGIPIAVTDTYTTNEDTAIALLPLTADTDPDGTTPMIQSINGTVLTPGTAQTIAVTNGTVNITAAGVITFTPALNYNGSVTFPYVITDGTLTATANQVITVTAVNDAPIAVTDNYTTNEDTAIALLPLTADTDPDGTTPTIRSINGTTLTPGTAQTIAVTNGTVNITAAGVITFTPALNYNGSVTFPYVITDGTLTATANQVITVTAVNDAPIAVTDNYTTNEDTAIALLPLTADTDPDGTTPTIQSINGTPLTPGTAQTIAVTNGIVSITTAGVITFTPALNYNGSVTFPYVITDGTLTATANQVITVTAVNDAPIAVTDNYTTNEDTAISLLPLTADTDPDGTTPTIQSINGTTLTPGTAQTIAVTNGIVNITAAGVITFTPALNYNGSVTFPYVITDGTLTATANQVITVTAVNDAPIAVTDNYTTNEDTAIALLPLTADTDPDGTTPTIQSINGTTLTPGTAQTIAVTNGTVNITAAGVITFTPALNYNGSVTFPYVITDGTLTATANQVITVTAVNDAPVAVTDTYTTNEDTAVALLPLTGDSDPDGTTPTIQSINGTPLTPGTAQTIAVTNGIVSITTAGVITFTPALNYNGSVTFPYVITDGTLTATANQVITVTAVNDAPIAVTDNYTTNEDTAISLLPLTADTDPDGTTPTIQSINGTTLTPGTAQTIAVTNGIVNITAAGVITFTPALNYNGSVTFPYVITDGTLTATANQVITVTAVNDAPIAVTDNYTTNEDTAIALLPLTADTDPDGTTPTIQSINGTTLTPGTAQTIAVTNGTVNITAAGVITFTPALNYNGSVTFPYVITDGTLTATANQVITVTAVNDAPIAVNDSATTNEDTPVTTTVTANDTDADGTIDVATVDLDPATAGIQTTFTVAGQGTYTVNNLGVVTFTPVLNFNGATTPINYTVNDNLGLVSNIATISITVTAVNDAPVAVNNTATTNEDTPVTITVTANDTDADGTINVATVDLDPATAGIQTTFTVTGEGTYTVNNLGVVTFTPVLNFNGTATPINYTVNDNSGLVSNIATISITVTAVNDAPVAVNNTATTNEDTPVNITVTANDTDADGTIDVATVDLDPATAGIQTTFTVTGQGTYTVNNLGVVTFTPVLNFNGATTPITYTVNDNSGLVSNIATISITVTAVNDAPVAVNNTATTNEDTPVTITVTANDTDADGTINVATVDLDPATAGIQTTFTVTGEGTYTVNNLGVVTFTPVLNFNGTATPINYTVNDNSGLVSNIATISITVTAVNDAPVAVNNTATTNEDTPVNITVTANDTDADGTIDVATVDLDPATAGIQTTFTVTGQGTYTVNNLGVVTFTPVLNFNGATTPITYTVNDNSGLVSNIATISITITPVNDAPVAIDDLVTSPEDTPVVLTPLVNDSDPDGTTPTIVSINGTALTPGIAQTITVPNGTVTISAIGVITFTPNLNFNGTATFPYEITDGTLTATANQVITITPVNDAPVAIDDLVTSPEDTPVVLTPLVNDSDPDGTTPTIVSINGTALTPGIAQTITVPNGIVTISTTGVITFTPNLNFNGTATFPYEITDGTLNTTANQIITVTPVNDPPVAIDDLLTSPEDTPVVLTPLVNDSDPDGTTPTIVSINGTALTPGIPQSITVPNGTVTITAAGVITFTPNLNFNGTATFPYEITDGTLNTTANQIITVTPVNDPPVAIDDLLTSPEDTPVVLTPLVNDSDPDGTTPTIVSINGTALTPGIAQTITVPNGIVTISTTGVITFTPNLNFNGTATFPYEITDGTVTATANQVITVTPVNDAPVAIDDLVTSPEDTPVVLTPLVNDSDPDGTTPTIVSINGTPLTPGIAQTITVPNGIVTISTTGVITFTPNLNFNGTATFPYVITDGTVTATANQVITVTPVNDAPVAIDDLVTSPEDTPVVLTPLVNDSDPDGTTPTIVSINGTDLTPGIAQTITVPNGIVTISTTGVITFTPNLNFNGTATFPYEITDGTVTATANQVITVTPVNDPPVAIDDLVTSPEDTPIVLTPLVNDSDPDGTTPTIVSINGTALIPGIAQTITVPNGIVTVSTTGVITFTPNLNFNGTATFPYIITDGLVTATANQVITVTAVNDVPVATLVLSTPIENDGSAKTILALTGTDLDGTVRPDRYIVTTLPTPAQGILFLSDGITPVTVNMVLTVADAAGLKFRPTAGFTGTVTFAYTATDNDNAISAPSIVSFVVTNIPPTTNDITIIPALAKNGIAQALPGLAGADVDGAVVNYIIRSLPDVLSGVLTLNGVPVVVDQVMTIAESRLLRFTPNVSFIGSSASFRIAARDNGGLVDLTPATVTIPLMESPSISVVKTAVFNDINGDGFAQAGETITYSFTITNTGNVTLSNVTITDNLVGLVLTGSPIATLGVGVTNSTAYSAVYPINQADINLGSVSNQATAQGTSPSGIVVRDLSDETSATNDSPTVLGISGCVIEIFNAIAPNGSGDNKIFRIRGLECYADNSVEIYNRWGVLVYEKRGYNNEENAFRGLSEGRVTVRQSEELPEGTYYYILRYKDSAATTFEKAGYLYINR